MSLRTKRIYEDPESDDGERILVDRLWPRGVAKENAELDGWMQEIAPSDELREWFDHDEGKWDGFVDRYRDELAAKEELVEELRRKADDGTVTLLYAAKDKQHNNAVALKQIIEDDA
ncbi:MAG: DUF488 family protein [Candidatus Nanohaloarchaea archaeon]|nr:DUF488 family protein [Candidatus Nanohaloarchaea archaeon]